MPPIQPRPSLAAQLMRELPRFEDLIHRAGLVTSQGDYNDVEEEAQAIAKAIVAPFRGTRAPAARPVNPPRHMSACGTKGVW